MRQVVLEGPRRLRLREAPVPSPGHGQALVRVEAVAVCGTDLHIYDGSIPAALPRILGHEMAGTVAQPGPGVEDLAPGDPVAVNPGLACGLCSLCMEGRPNLCPEGGLMGREADGGLQEYLVVDRPQLFPLPPHIPPEEGALAQLLSTVVHAQRGAGIGPGVSVVVLGQGASGLLHTALAALAGGRPVVAVGRSPWKLELALRMGAHVAVQAGAGDPLPEIREAVGRLGADVVIETAGVPATVAQALAMCRPGGVVVQYGIPAEPLDSLDLYSLYLKEVRLCFPRAMTPPDFGRAVDLLAQGALDVGPLVSRRHPLEAAPQVFRSLEEGARSLLRVVFVAGERGP